VSTLAVLTPSFAGDYDRCVDLNRSVLTHAETSVEHHLVVPRADLPLFRRLSGPRTLIHDERSFLPKSFVPVRTFAPPPLRRLTVNLRRPYPPLRGWILQQVVKLAAAAQLDAEVVVLVDSDIEFIRPFGQDTFRRDGVVRFYREPDGVAADKTRHVIWHRVARQLLGLAPAPPPYDDYVSSLLAWDPAIVRRLLARVEAVTGRRWTSAVGRQLHFSEWTLYGMYVAELADSTARSFTSDDSLCHSYWDETPLTDRGIRDFLGEVAPADVAVMISAKSGTPTQLRRQALSSLTL
jgi:hypothetical protein